MERIAFRLGILPHDLTRMVPAEVWALAEGWAWRLAQEYGARATEIALMPSFGERKLAIPVWANNFRAGLRNDPSQRQIEARTRDLLAGLLFDIREPVSREDGE